MMKKNKPLSPSTRRQFLKEAGIVAAGLTLAPSFFLGCKTAKNFSVEQSSSLLKSVLYNPTPIKFSLEPVRLKIAVPNTDFILTADGAEVPYQIEVLNGERFIWVASSLEPASESKFEVREGKKSTFEPKVVVKQKGDFFVLDNGKVKITVPAKSSGDKISGPISAIVLPDGRSVGQSFWNTNFKLKNFSAEILGDGTVFGKIRLRYDFEGMAGVNANIPAFSQIDIKLAPHWDHAEIFEQHEMLPEDYWEFTMSENWTPNTGVSKQFHNGPGGDGNFVVPSANRPLLPLQNVSYSPELYINLVPRWNQHFKDGWAFAATDGSQSISALAVRASQWKWPHDNGLECVVKHTGNYAGVRATTWRGQRLWWLSPNQNPISINYLREHAWETLDKINHEYVLNWPGKKTSWWQFNPYDSDQTNPTHTVRKIGSEALANAGSPAKDTTLIRFQTLINRDSFGSYWDYWSPENPNFFTDFYKVPIALASNLRHHPDFEIFKKQAEQKFKEDLYHSITMPSGAGQECPFYSYYALSHWLEIAKMGEKLLAFDKDFIKERINAADRFYKRITYPDGVVRRGSPLGDSHPDRNTGTGMPIIEVLKSDVEKWTTDELEGFGVVFTNNAGTNKETYLSFKSGPNRGHYHGDQLAFHYCANAKPEVVDHHCSYHPRAGQEHMHNRLAFFTDDMPYANMDGYEHILAFKTSADVDISVGQVESKRIRKMVLLPPEQWDARYPRITFSEPLIYRRTVVFMKNRDQDYFVFRDQYWADRPLNAAYCLHTYGHEPVQNGQAIDFGNITLFCATPQDFELKKFNWSHNNGGFEETKGVRLEIKGQTGEFITVMYPGIKVPTMKAIPGGVQVGEDIITFSGSAPTYGDSINTVEVSQAGKILHTLNSKDIDFNRWQGEIGLFVPDVGYVFGEIPDWLAKQRSSQPEWAN